VWNKCSASKTAFPLQAGSDIVQFGIVAQLEERLLHTNPRAV